MTAKDWFIAGAGVWGRQSTEGGNKQRSHVTPGPSCCSGLRAAPPVHSCLDKDVLHSRSHCPCFWCAQWAWKRSVTLGCPLLRLATLSACTRQPPFSFLFVFFFLDASQETQPFIRMLAIRKPSCLWSVIGWVDTWDSCQCPLKAIAWLFWVQQLGPLCIFNFSSLLQLTFFHRGPLLCCCGQISFLPSFPSNFDASVHNLHNLLYASFIQSKSLSLSLSKVFPLLLMDSGLC